MKIMAGLKQVYYDGNYPHVSFPKVELTTIPSSMKLDQPRRGKSVINEQFKTHLFLNASTLPSKEDAKISNVDSTVNEPEVTGPYMQLLKNITSMEQSITRQLSDLKTLGANRILERQMTEATKSSDANKVEGPESAEPESTGVVAIKEVKQSAPPKRKRPVTLPLPLPISDHEAKKRKVGKKK